MTEVTGQQVAKAWLSLWHAAREAGRPAPTVPEVRTALEAAHD